MPNKIQKWPWMPPGCVCCPIMFISCLLSPEILSKDRINGTGSIFPQEHLTTSVQKMSNYLWLFWKVPADQIPLVTRQNFDLSCLRLLIFAVEVRSTRGWWRWVAFVNVSLQKRSSLLIVGTRLLLIAASGLLLGRYLIPFGTMQMVQTIGQPVL